MPACSYCGKSYTTPCDGKDPTCGNKRWLDAGNRPGEPEKVKRVPLVRKQTRVPLVRRPTT